MCYKQTAEIKCREEGEACLGRLYTLRSRSNQHLPTISWLGVRETQAYTQQGPGQRPAWVITPATEHLQEKLWWITGGLNDICYQSPLRGDNVEGVTTYKCQHRCTLERAEPAVLAKEAVVLHMIRWKRLKSIGWENWGEERISILTARVLLIC